MQIFNKLCIVTMLIVYVNEKYLLFGKFLFKKSGLTTVLYIMSKLWKL